MDLSNPFEDWNIDFSEDPIMVYHKCGQAAVRLPVINRYRSVFICKECGEKVPSILEAGLPKSTGCHFMYFY